VGILLANVTLLDGRRVDIAVQGEAIAAIEPRGSLSGAETFDADGGLCVRPLTDSHIHLDKAGTAAENARPPSSIPEAIAAMSQIKEREKDQPDRLLQRMDRTIRQLEASGTRFVRALIDVDETWGLAAFEAARAVREAFAGRVEIRIVAFPQEGLTPRVADMLRQAAEEGADGIGAHTDIDEDVKGHLATAAEIARQWALPLEVHVDEAASPGSFRLPHVLEIAADLPLALVHCLSLGTLPAPTQDVWIERIREAGAAVVVAPTIVGFGLPLPPVRSLMDAGVPVLLGLDNLQDVFMPLGTPSVLDRARQLAFMARLTDAIYYPRLIQAATDSGFELVSGQRASFAPGAPASLMVFEASTPFEILNGRDRRCLTMMRGSVVERGGNV
jgi:cytosine deaminase